MSKAGARLIKNLTEAGAPLDTEGDSATFNFTISPVSSFDVDSRLIIDYSQKMRHAARKSAFSKDFSLASILLIPVVLNPSLAKVQGAKRFKKKENSYAIKRNIDFAEWQSASQAKRKKILLHFMRGVVGDIPSKYISEPDRETLLRTVLDCV
ncbi:hypothetical protein [Herbaspirillum sp. YR522]|uniref:hypothetical protein n=1 Tax=Herbaspirillum sp. YR522 TaxID=1144342 RepID=UPI0012F88AC8|nr:hypothetical protein [Herbaspirillum sp. YR522]